MKGVCPCASLNHERTNRSTLLRLDCYLLGAQELDQVGLQSRRIVEQSVQDLHRIRTPLHGIHDEIRRRVVAVAAPFVRGAASQSHQTVLVARGDVERFRRPAVRRQLFFLHETVLICGVRIVEFAFSTHTPVHHIAERNGSGAHGVRYRIDTIQTRIRCSF
jgi:hypothetical protein